MSHGLATGRVCIGKGMRRARPRTSRLMSLDVRWSCGGHWRGRPRTDSQAPGPVAGAHGPLLTGPSQAGGAVATDMSTAYGARQGQWPGQGAGPERGTIHPLFLRLLEPAGQEEMRESQPAALTRPAGPAARGWRTPRQGPAEGWRGCSREGPAARLATLRPRTEGRLQGAWESRAAASCAPTGQPALCTPALSPARPLRSQALAAGVAEGGGGSAPSDVSEGVRRPSRGRLGLLPCPWGGGTREGQRPAPSHPGTVQGWECVHTCDAWLCVCAHTWACVLVGGAGVWGSRPLASLPLLKLHAPLLGPRSGGCWWGLPWGLRGAVRRPEAARSVSGCMAAFA